MALEPENLYGDLLSQTPQLRAYPDEDGIWPGQLLGNGDADVELPHLTPLTKSGTAYKVWSAADGANETYVITAAATAATDGTFTLTFEGETTSALAHDAAAAAILAALNALGSISPGDVTVTDAGSGLGTGNGTSTIVFQGQYANRAVTLTANFASLVGNTHVLSNSVDGEGSDISGFLWAPGNEVVTQLETGEILVQILRGGVVQAQDVPLPTGENQSVLNEALIAPSLRANDLRIRGLLGV